jgi:transposase-like protein
LGHWVSDGEEGASFWLSVVTDLKNRGVENIFIACVDGLTGFKEAIRSVFPQVEIQRCIIHHAAGAASLPSVGFADPLERATASRTWSGRIAKPLPLT